MSVAQFGLGNRRQQQGGAFEQLQEQAKQQAAAGAAGDFNGAGMADMQKLMEEAMKNPEAQQYLEQMGHNFEEAMEKLSGMSPEEMKKQLEEAMSSLTDSSVFDSIVQEREAILKQLEMTKAVPPEELAKMKVDPEYFELKMRESFGEIKDLFSNPEMAEYMTKAISGMSEIFSSSSEFMKEVEKLVESGELSDNSKIEEARLQLLKGDMIKENPLLKEMLGDEEMKKLVQDPEKFRENVLKGQKTLFGRGAGIGEL